MPSHINPSKRIIAHNNFQLDYLLRKLFPPIYDLNLILCYNTIQY